MRLESHDNYLCGLFISSTSHTSRIQTVFHNDSLSYLLPQLTNTSQTHLTQTLLNQSAGMGRSGLQVQFA